MSYAAEWPPASSAPSWPLCSASQAPPPTPGWASAPPATHLLSWAPGRDGSHGSLPHSPPASDWPVGGARLRAQPQECARCRTRSSPLWRREAAGGHVCNGCSLQERSNNRPLLRAKRRASVSQRPGVCVTCGTSTTSLWRRSPAGQPVCNACGLYYKLHQVERPPELRKDGIRTRRRKVATRTGGNGKAGNLTNQRPDSLGWPRPLTFCPETSMLLCDRLDASLSIADKHGWLHRT